MRIVIEMSAHEMARRYAIGESTSQFLASKLIRSQALKIRGVHRALRRVVELMDDRKKVGADGIRDSAVPGACQRRDANR
jgi:hypothetical protein